jgi:hypothetical protein
MGLTALLPLRKTLSYWHLLPLKIRCPRPGFNQWIFGTMTSTLPVDHQGRPATYLICVCFQVNTSFHPSLFDCSHNSWWNVQITEPQYAISLHLHVLTSKYPTNQYLVLRHLYIAYVLTLRLETNSTHTYKQQIKLYFVHFNPYIVDIIGKNA